MARLLLPRRNAVLLTPEKCVRNTEFKVIRNVASTSGSNEGTLKYQETLPKFSVPPLIKTFQNYLHQYKLYVNHQEYNRTKKVVEEFCKPGGIGGRLQEALLQRADSKENWLSEWWRILYLQVRDPNVLTSSPSALFHRQKFSDVNGQIEYAAKLIFSTARFASLLARHEYPPIKLEKQPICMDQLFLVFSSCRIPGRIVDHFYCHRVDSPDAPRHIVIIRNNHMFKFDILEPDKSPLDAASILQQLEYIVNQTHDQGPPIGLVTAHQRTKWADLYSKMKEDETNAQSLHDIQSSLFVLSLDQTEAFEDAEEKLLYEARLALCGGGTTQNTSNRWHDKNLQMFKFDILEPDKSPLDAASILQQLEYIVNQTHDQGPPIGLVTAHQRTKWADLYSKMKEDETNAQSLHDIQSSLFVLSLDQTEALEDAEEKLLYEARLALCGGGTTQNTSNRWHDKNLQLFVGSNGESGAAGDHSHSEGIASQTLAEMAFRYTNQKDRLSSDFARSGLSCPQKLEFVLSDDLSRAIAEAGKNIDHILGYFATKERVFSSFGKTFLKSHQVAHDGFVQIAIQMTYWRLFGKFPRIWEAVSLQRFKLGRVENVRTVTSDTIAFIKIFHDKNVQSVDKVVMLQKAVKVHMKSIFDAQMGKGMERHLFGLQRVAEEKKIDASKFFDDPSWEESSSIDIRTTALQGDATRAVYAPLIQKSCVFIWYNFNPDFMRFAITAREDKTAIDVNKFLEGLFVCLLDMKDLLESVLHTKD